MKLAGLTSLAAVVVLAGCGGTDTPTQGATDPNEAMLANLPSCDRVDLDTAPEISPDVAGLVLPDEARMTSVLEQGPLTTVEGTVRMTPLDVRAHYESRDDVELLRAEDEVFEAEILVRTAGKRMYVLAGALCADGTSLTAVVGPDSDDAGLPQFQTDLQ